MHLDSFSLTILGIGLFGIAAGLFGLAIGKRPLSILQPGIPSCLCLVGGGIGAVGAALVF